MPSITYLCLFALLLVSCYCDDSSESSEELHEIEGIATSTEEEEDRNNTKKDLYVIRTVVYEIGILTDAENDTDSNETHERLDISIFDPETNGSFIDLSNIPLPIQTNLSSVALTGLISGDLGTVFAPPNSDDGNLEGSNIPVFPHKQVTVTRNISTVNKQEGADILASLPQILGLHNAGLKDDDGEKNNGTEAAGES